MSQASSSQISTALVNLRKAKSAGYWPNRILSEVEYLYHLSQVKNGKYDKLVEKAMGFLQERLKEDGCITKQTAQRAEEMLAGAAEDAKAFHIICAAHAHIDMNWMWAWNETVAITLDTFRTMLDLMEEYPEFTFSQSQASVYKIVEEYAPDMLEEIKKRVKEGRWEITASTWVEADKNMPNGESMARHILYTKQYLSKLLDIDPDTLNLDFEPDTFGHSINVPEILAKGGVKYYYHCRGDEGHNLQRWVAPSGRSIIVYREPFWYLGGIEPDMAFAVPKLCNEYGLNKALKVYGVGDHGGGPTRRDIERIIDMNNWPIFPKITFGTFKEYFSAVEEIADTLPEVTGERNFIFTGCYTSQSRIKMANRKGEAALNEAETFASMGKLAVGANYSNAAFAKAWQNVLFNQFHDIIPGSGVIDTREYAMGLFQQTMATAGTAKKLALQAIASKIDTSHLVPDDEDIRETRSEGAGVGFGVKQFRISQSSRGAGKTRIFHVFNPSLTAREELVEIVVWDWQGDPDNMMFKDVNGTVIRHQILDSGTNQYWGHTFVRILIPAKVPACGYSTYVLTEKDDIKPRINLPRDPRVERNDEPVLENEYLKVIFDPVDCTIVSLVDKRTGQELVDPTRPAGVFRLISEDPIRGMTSWRVGRYMNIENLVENVKITGLERNSLRQTVTYEIQFHSSKLEVTVSLDAGSTHLNYAVKCDWHEIGRPKEVVPQLNFYLPVSYECDAFKYDVPFGVITREPMDMDVPGNSWIQGLSPDEGQSLVRIITDSKYGFRGYDDALAVTLIRSSYDPDPYPEFGIHEFSFAISVDNGLSNRELVDTAYDYNHPLTVISARPQKGDLPLTKSFIGLVEGSVAVSAVKMPETGDPGLIVRVYETDGEKTTTRLAFAQPVKAAYVVDLNENRVDSAKVDVNTNEVSFDVEAFSVVSIRVEFWRSA